MLTTMERPAMGSRALIAADLGTTHLEPVHEVIAAAERRWSRFRVDSVVSAINRSSEPVAVDPDTQALLDFAASARTVTNGWFHAGPKRAGVGVSQRQVQTQRELDLGGIAKGWTADLASDRLAAAGASVAVVDIGGDVRVRAERMVHVECEAPDRRANPVVFAVRDAGIAMSGPTRHGNHLIDPRTGQPADARIALVVARTAAGAEALATAAAVAPIPDAVRFLASVGAAAWLIEPDGSASTIGHPERFLADHGWLADRSARRWEAAPCPPS